MALLVERGLCSFREKAGSRRARAAGEGGGGAPRARLSRPRAEARESASVDDFCARGSRSRIVRGRRRAWVYTDRHGCVTNDAEDDGCTQTHNCAL